ncbi:hypothetical protein IH779_01075 [Patescibacteria group bacterium]|nr:hypothetical protein [Patescibacteria group bacterium]
MNNQKFFDIIPPKKYQKEVLAKKPRVSYKEKSQQTYEIAPSGRFPVKKSFLFILLLVFLGGISLHFIFQKTVIVIWPVTQETVFETSFKVSSKIDLPDIASKTLPGKIFSSEKVVFQQFQSSGKGLEEAKSEGVIRVYNTYSTYSQTLIIHTRFVSAEGKLFRSIKKVTIPGGKYEKGKLQPGFLDIEVVAAEAGKEYNIGPSTFSIPGFAGTVRYTAFYGKSFQQMKGGLKGEVLQVTQQDLDAAVKVLKGKIERETENMFKNTISEEFIFIDEAFQKKERSLIFSAKAGETKESFTVEIGILFNALVFKKQDLEDIIKEFIMSEIPQDMALKPDSLTINYEPLLVDVEEGRMTLNSDFSATIYSRIDTDLLKKEIAGKSLRESKMNLDGNPNIVRAEVQLFPLWLTRIPKDLQKIYIKLNLDGLTGSEF